MTKHTSKWSRAYWSDLAERVGATLLGALLGCITLTSTTPVDWTDAKAVWAVLGIPTAVSLIKGLLANMAAPESGPSLLPSPPAPDVTPARNEKGSVRLPFTGASRDRSLPGKRRVRARRLS